MQGRSQRSYLLLQQPFFLLHLGQPLEEFVDLVVGKIGWSLGLGTASVGLQAEKQKQDKNNDHFPCSRLTVEFRLLQGFAKISAKHSQMDIMKFLRPQALTTPHFYSGFIIYDLEIHIL